MTTLDKAMAAFVASPTHGDRTKMNVPAWAATYHCGPEDVRAAFEAAITHHSRRQRIGEEQA